MPPKILVDVEIKEESVLTQGQISKSIYELTHQINELKTGYNDLKT